VYTSKDVTSGHKTDLLRFQSVCDKAALQRGQWKKQVNLTPY